MGTNYYRIPTHEEVEQQKLRLIEEIQSLELTTGNIESGFSSYSEGTWDSYNPWDRFKKDMKIHLGKRSGGWRFCWNFNDNKFYSNKEELLSYIRSGRVVDEYGTELPSEEFIEMALNWCPDGLIGNAEYNKNLQKKNPNYWFSESFFDKEIDGLRVASSTEFC
jgi:hypothetical protein